MQGKRSPTLGTPSAFKSDRSMMCRKISKKALSCREREAKEEQTTADCSLVVDVRLQGSNERLSALRNPKLQTHPCCRCGVEVGPAAPESGGQGPPEYASQRQNACATVASTLAVSRWRATLWLVPVEAHEARLRLPTNGNLGG